MRTLAVIVRFAQLDQFRHTLFDAYLRTPAKDLFRLAEIGEGMTYIAQPSRQVFDRATDHLGNPIDRYSAAASDIQCTAVGYFAVDRQQIGPYDVPNMGEVARLCAIAMNREWSAFPSLPEKNAEYSHIRPRGRHAWPEDIEVAKRQGLHSVKLMKQVRVLFADQLLQGVRIEGVRRHLFVQRERVLIPIDRRRAREYDPPHTRIPRCYQNVQRPERIYHMSFRGLIDRQRNAGQCRLVKDRIDTSECGRDRIKIADVGLNQCSPWIQIPAAASRKVIEDLYAKTARDECIGKMRANEPCAPGYEHPS